MITSETWPELAQMMFKLEDEDQQKATSITMEAIMHADWPYSQCGLGFGTFEDASSKMRQYGSELYDQLKEALDELAA